MNVQTRHPYEGLLHKYTNAMKGWQYRWFILSPETGELHYFLSESEKNQRPRCSIYLAGAVIAPSDEDSNTFTVNSATGERSAPLSALNVAVQIVLRMILSACMTNKYILVTTIDNYNNLVDKFYY